MLVFAGVRLFRKSLAKHQKADQSAIAPKDRHQAFRRKRPQIAGRLVTLWDVPGFSALRDLPEHWQRGWNCVRLSRNEDCPKAEGNFGRGGAAGIVSDSRATGPH